MLRAIRRTRFAPLFIAVALLATMPGTMASLLHHDDDDALCRSAFFLHDHHTHQVGGGGPSSLPEPQHCFVCHGLQSPFAIQTSVRLGAPPTDVQLLVSSFVTGSSAIITGAQSARAPPLA